MATVGDDVEGVDDRNDSGGEGNRFATKSARVATAVPPLVMGENADRELGIEWRERREDRGAAARMGRDRPSLGRGEPAVVVNDVEERFVDLADVVEERDALDAAKDVVPETSGIAEDQRIARDLTDMLAGFVVVGFDRVENRLEGGGREPFGAGTAVVLDAPGGAEDQSGNQVSRSHQPDNRKKRGQRSGRVDLESRRAFKFTRRKGIIPACARTRDELDLMTDTAVVSKRGAQRWDRGHPWIYRSDVERRPEGPAGVVRVTDARGKGLGVALWSPASEISLRLLDRKPDATIDAEWWRDRLAAALERRQQIARDTSAYRILHGEADGCPSLICDRYDRWLVVQLMSDGVEGCRPQILDALSSLPGVEGVLARNDVPLRAKEKLPVGVELLRGSVPETVEVVEHGVRYLAAPWTGQKTGAFLDQRENRRMIAAHTKGRALDCFSYHGSFALHMAAAAESVLALDVSGDALERAADNARLNGYTNLETRTADAFDFLKSAERARERFDTIVLDPPAFAKSRSALPAAIRGYKEINLRAMRLLSPKGVLLTASCSFHLSKAHFLEMLGDAAADSGRRLELRQIRGQPADHPEVLTIPETGYLKSALVVAM